MTRHPAQGILVPDKPAEKQYASLKCFDPSRNKLDLINNIYKNVAGSSYRDTDMKEVPPAIKT